MTGDLDSVRLERALAERGARLGLPLVVRDVTESTNDDARAAAHDGAPPGAAFIADTQTRGRGRLGRSWHSPPGANLYVSFVLRPAVAVGALVWLPLAAGLAVADALAPITPTAQMGPIVAGTCRLGIKWPNDVLLDGLKVAGVLSEAEIDQSAARFVVVGIGINVGEREFPAELSRKAISLAQAGVAVVDRGSLFVELCVALGRRVDALEHGRTWEIQTDLERLDALAGKTVTIGGMRGQAVGIDHEGRLRVVCTDGVERAFGSGEALLESPSGPSVA